MKQRLLFLANLLSRLSPRPGNYMNRDGLTTLCQKSLGKNERGVEGKGLSVNASSVPGEKRKKESFFPDMYHAFLPSKKWEMRAISKAKGGKTRAFFLYLFVDC